MLLAVFFRILEPAAHKTADFRPLSSHLTKRPNKTKKGILSNACVVGPNLQETFFRGMPLMDALVVVDQKKIYIHQLGADNGDHLEELSSMMND